MLSLLQGFYLFILGLVIYVHLIFLKNLFLLNLLSDGPSESSLASIVRKEVGDYKVGEDKIGDSLET